MESGMVDSKKVNVSVVAVAYFLISRYLLQLFLLSLAVISIVFSGCANIRPENEVATFNFANENPANIGDNAPLFVLTDAYGQKIDLAHSLKYNDAVVLVFYRGFFSDICFEQLGELQGAYRHFQSRNVELLTVSMDSPSETRQMADKTGAHFPVLADSDGTVARLYAVYDLLGDGLATRSTFIIWSDGIIKWRHIAESTEDITTVGDILLPVQRFALGREANW